jgi:hypothetical protein
MSTLLRRIEKSGIDETEIEAFRPGGLRLTPCEIELANIGFRSAFAAGFGEKAPEQRTPFRRTS